MATGDLSYYDGPVFSADEFMILKTMDPKFKNKDQKEMETLHQISMKDHADMRQKGIVQDDDIRPSENYPIQPGGLIPPSDNIHGGFAWAALAPVASAVVPSLVNLVTKGISSLVSRIKNKSGKGIMPAGGALFAPNTMGYFGRGETRKAVMKYIPDILAVENEIRQLRGKKFWRAVFKVVKNFSQTILIDDFGLKPAEVKMLYRTAFRQMFPNSLIKFMKTGSDEIEGKGNKTPETHLRSIMRPIATWALNKATGNQVDQNKLKMLLNKELGFLDSRYARGSGKRLTEFWRKTKSFIKKVGKKILPVIANVSKDQIPGIIKNITNKLNVSDEMRPFVDIATDLTGKLTDQIPRYELDPTQAKVADVINKNVPSVTRFVEDRFSKSSGSGIKKAFGRGRTITVQKNREKIPFQVRQVL